MAGYTLNQIHKAVKGSEIKNCPNPDEIIIESVASLRQLKINSISYVSSKKFIKDAQNSKSVAIFTSEAFSSGIDKPLLIVKNVDLALIDILKLIYPQEITAPVISTRSVISPTAKIGQNVSIGDFVTIGDNAVIGDDCVIENGTVIGNNVKLGKQCKIGPNNVFHHGVIIGERMVSFGNSTFGSDGFRFVHHEGIHLKVPHIGGLVFGNDTEVGSNCSFDRGVLEDTIIGDFCKFDNQVHIAHNCILGRNVLIAANSAVAGSTTLGDNVIIGGCSAVADHLEICANTIIAGGTGVRNSITQSNIYAGAEFGLNFTDFQKLRVNIKHVVGFQNWIKRIKNIEKVSGIEEI